VSRSKHDCYRSSRRATSIRIRGLIAISSAFSDSGPTGEYFFVTEELEGGTLRTILDEVAPEVPPEEEAFSASRRDWGRSEVRAREGRHPRRYSPGERAS
jgi:hypothetical protein